MQSDRPPSGNRYRFNAPPGWPTYPPDWVPPPGWQPDPAWPPAPPGWPFWSPVEAPAVKPKRRLGRAVQVIVAVVGFIATVTGLGFALQDHFKTPSLADWTTKANSVCVKRYGDVLTPLVAVYPPMVAEFAAIQAGTGDRTREQGIATQLAGLAGAFGSMTSELRDIPQPKGNKDIPDLVKAGEDISKEFGALSTVMSNLAAGQVTMDNLNAGVQSMQLMSSTSMPAWARLSQRLNLDQCQGFGVPAGAASPTASPVPPSPTAAQLTAAEQSLVGRVKSAVLAGCVPAKASESGDVVAAVNCRAAQAGPTKLPLVMQFASADAMNGWMARYAAGIAFGSGGSCADGPYNNQWTSPATNNARAGQLVCRPVAAGDFAVAWSFDTAAVVVLADGAEGPSLYQWWTGNAYLITSS
jgi:hypothetical protein